MPIRALRATLALVALIAPERAVAQSPTFLPISGGARAFALAGASVALAEDASAAFLNPARLAFVGGRSFTAGYARLVEGIPSDRIEVAYEHPIGGDIAAPLQRGPVRRLALGLAIDYQRLELSQGSGYGELTGSLAAAFAPMNFLSLGMSARGLTARSEVEGLDAHGAALDIGLAVALYPSVDAAAVMHNALGRVRYSASESEAPGRSTTIALAVRGRRWLAVEGDYTTEYDGARSYALGAEALPAAVLAVRAGARYWSEPGRRLVPAAGAGLRHGPYSLDYSVQIEGGEGLGLVHRLTLGGRP